MHPLLDRFSALLLDLNGTFMFGQDRFGPDEDYHSTYRNLGGQRLSSGEVRAAIDACHFQLNRHYHDPASRDAFPPVAGVLAELPETIHRCRAERELLERVIAEHEVGRVPAEYAAALARLARTHRLALVSNVWSRKDLYLAELHRSGTLDLFAALVFSSDGPSIKPSRVLFDQAIAVLGVARSEAVVVGDSLECDVAGASKAGLASVWIDHAGRGPPADGVRPDWTIRDLRELVRPQLRDQP